MAASTTVVHMSNNNTVATAAGVRLPSSTTTTSSSTANSNSNSNAAAASTTSSIIYCCLCHVIPASLECFTCGTMSQTNTAASANPTTAAHFYYCASCYFELHYNQLNTNFNSHSYSSIITCQFKNCGHSNATTGNASNSTLNAPQIASIYCLDCRCYFCPQHLDHYHASNERLRFHQHLDLLTNSIVTGGSAATAAAAPNASPAASPSRNPIIASSASPTAGICFLVFVSVLLHKTILCSFVLPFFLLPVANR